MGIPNVTGLVEGFKTGWALDRQSRQDRLREELERQQVGLRQAAEARLRMELENHQERIRQQAQELEVHQRNVGRQEAQERLRETGPSLPAFRKLETEFPDPEASGFVNDYENAVRQEVRRPGGVMPSPQWLRQEIVAPGGQMAPEGDRWVGRRIGTPEGPVIVSDLPNQDVMRESAMRASGRFQERQTAVEELKAARRPEPMDRKAARMHTQFTREMNAVRNALSRFNQFKGLGLTEEDAANRAGVEAGVTGFIKGEAELREELRKREDQIRTKYRPLGERMFGSEGADVILGEPSTFQADP